MRHLGCLHVCVFMLYFSFLCAFSCLDEGKMFRWRDQDERYVTVNYTDVTKCRKIPWHSLTNLQWTDQKRTAESRHCYVMINLSRSDRLMPINKRAYHEAFSIQNFHCKLYCTTFTNTLTISRYWCCLQYSHTMLFPWQCCYF